MRLNALRFLSGTALTIGACASIGLAQHVNQDIPADADWVDVLGTTTADRTRYDGFSVVSVQAGSMRELMAASAIADGLWSESHKLTSTEFLIRADRITDLETIGLETRVLIPNVQTIIDAEWAAIQAATAQLQGQLQDQQINPQARGTDSDTGIDETWYQVFRQNNEINQRLNQLASERPDLATVSTFGQSIEGRNLRTIRITGPDTEANPVGDRPQIVWNGCQHAREWANPMTVMYLAEALVRLYDTDPQIKRLVDTVDFVIAPMVNPDGYVYSWSDERLWRKNRRSGFGVDLNRNWPTAWGGEGSSGNTDSNTYRGNAPLSEPESFALSQLILSQPNLVGHIDFHTYSQLILRPFGFTEDPLPSEEEAFLGGLGADMQSAILDAGGVFYQNIPGNQLYIASGILSDWAYVEAGAASYTYELRPDRADPGFILPPEEILPTAREILAAMRVYSETLTQPFRIDSVDTPNGQITDVEPIGVTIEINELTRSFNQDVHDPASVTLSWNDASPAGPAAGSVAMTSATGTTYSADLPALPCGSTLSYRVSAASTDGTEIASREFTVEAQTVTVTFSDDAETDLGWTLGVPSDTASSGLWQRATPEGTTAQPASDISADGTQCFITGAEAGSNTGSNDIDGGITTLISPRLDATAPAEGGGDAVLSYARWYSNDRGNAPDADVMEVAISNDDGASWTSLESVTENANQWVRVSFRIADFVEPTEAVRVRFIAGDLDEGSLVEAGVDEVEIVFEGCPEVPAPSADWNDDGQINILDIVAFVNDFNAQNPATDLDASGTLNILDVVAFITLWNG
jgi:hypothetical protein